MEEQNSSKGQTFTLMIFGGIVVLCSIFFILGMLVGRTQGIKLATVAAAEAAVKANPPKTVVDERPELGFYDDVDKKKPAVLEPPSRPQQKPAPPKESVLSPPPRIETPPAPVNTLSIQVAALKKSTDAAKQVDELKKKGFKALILAPAPGDNNPLYRVQVPVPNQLQAELMKKQLEAAGYKPILKQ
jgi:cell division septation protein DedD